MSNWSEICGLCFFLRRYDELLAKTNIHNIHGQCYKDPASLLLSVKKTALSGFIDKKQNITTPLSNANQEKESINIFNLMSEIFEAKMKDLSLAMKPYIIAMPRLKMGVWTNMQDLSVKVLPEFIFMLEIGMMLYLLHILWSIWGDWAWDSSETFDPG